MTTITTPVSNRSNTRTIDEPDAVTEQKDTAMRLIRQVQLINEALSRARMRRPQTTNSEATRPARQIMLSSRRREQNRLMGL